MPNANLTTTDGQGAVAGAISEVLDDSSAQTGRPSVNENSDCADSTPTSFDASRRSTPSSGQDRSRNGTLSSSNKLKLVNTKTSGRKSSGTLDKADDSLKRRKVVVADEETTDDNVMAPPCMVTLDPGVIIVSVAAGGRHTLALSGE